MEANYIQDKENKYSLAIFNIDSLKNINDTYGYDAGDMIIQNFTSILKTTTRAIDFIAYIENKEFIVILPAVKINGAYTFADKIRRKVTQTKFKYKNTIIPITVSAGTSNRGSCSSLEATLKSANKYLHIAKAGGKNRVEPS
jgi:diguanylate cyclase (GGDEF)-like protein